ncbi:MAG: hypothetical protein U0570_09745 [Phycisphaerales bacterium]
MMLRLGAGKWGQLLSAWRLPVRDDAGSQRELLAMRALPSGTPRLDRVRDKAHLVYGELSNFGRTLARMVVVVLPMAVAMPVLMLWLRPKGVPIFAVGCVVVAVAMFFGLMLTYRDFRRLAPRAGEVADAFLDEGICPCCGYNLAGAVESLGADPDPAQRVPCAECGAAWLRSRIRRVQSEETAEAREPFGMRAILRAQAMIYSSLASVDDAGSKISLARYGDLKAMRARASGDYRERLSRCVGALRFRGLWMRLLFVSLVLPATFAILFDFWRRPMASLGLFQALQGLGLVLWVIGAVAVLGSDMGRTGPRRVALLKSGRICPGCGGDLGTGSGRQSCGECRAVWELGEVGGGG